MERILVIGGHERCGRVRRAPPGGGSGARYAGSWDRLGDKRTALLRKDAAGTFVGRRGETDYVVDTVMWLLRAGYVSGETIHVEGGACHKSARRPAAE